MTVQLTQMSQKYDKTLKNIMEEIANHIVQGARMRVYSNQRHQSGNSPLAESIRVAKDMDNSLRVFTDIPYARYVEFGSINQPARPFLTPAIEAAKGTFSNFISDLKP